MTASGAPLNLIDELSWRGLLHQCTDEPGLRAHLAGGAAAQRSIYAGFDPTADSVTIGNLVPLMMLRHVQRSGHRPVVLMGGGTGLIGDPSGKSAERELQSDERVRANVESQRRVFERVLDFSGPSAATIANNADWLTKLGYIEVLRDVGKHFSVNQMVQRDSVKSRLEGREQGISYTEFSYMILQAYDFLHLFRSRGVTVQLGGSDQYGNILSGCDLIRRHASGGTALQSSPSDRSGDRSHQDPYDQTQPRAFGLTAPLVTKADGGKFGKTESGAIWLSPHRTSPYAYYQFWLNASDADAGRFLRIFTLLDRPAIEALEAEQAASPGARPAQRALAREATAFLHGKDEMLRAEAAAGALFSGQIAGLPLTTLEEVLAAAPSSTHAKAQLAGEGLPLLDLLKVTVCKSGSEAKQALAEGSIAVNGVKSDGAARLTTADLLHGRIIALRRGKKNWFVTRWE